MLYPREARIDIGIQSTTFALFIDYKMWWRAAVFSVHQKQKFDELLIHPVAAS